MKFVAIVILYIIPLFAVSQDFRSEYIKYKSYNQIKGDKLIRTDSVILQINERMGDHDAEILINYSKGDKVSVGDAWIEDMQGNILRKLKNKEITDRSSISNISLYEDDFVKTFELKHNQYPYRIVYSFRVIYSKFLSLASLNYTNSRTPIISGELVAEAPIDLPITFKQRNTDPPAIDTINNNIRYVWKYNYRPLKTKELNASPNNTEAPIIHAAPINFKYGVEGNKENWKSFGNWVYRLNRGRDILPAPEQAKINSLLSGVTDDKEKAKILYQYLQDYTRYINVSINIGGMQTYPASYVYTNKYGDCKALTNYMQAMLKYAGIKSYYTLIFAGGQIVDVDTTFPSQVFNHAILTIPFEKDTVYLECTSKNTPFGYMGAFTQARKALLIDENNSHFVNIPPLSPNNVLCNRSIFVDLKTSNIKLTSTARGDNYENLIYLASDINKNTIDKYIRNTILTGSYDLINFNLEKAAYDNPSIKLNAECQFHNLLKKYGDNLIIEPFSIEIPTYEAPETRKSDLQLDYPSFYKDTICYSLPDDKKVKLPEDINMESDYGKYSISYKQKNNEVYIYKSILISSGRYNLIEYKEFYDFITTVKNNELKKIYLQYI